jgi:hypothetical protein
MACLRSTRDIGQSHLTNSWRHFLDPDDNSMTVGGTAKVGDTINLTLYEVRLPGGSFTSNEWHCCLGARRETQRIFHVRVHVAFLTRSLRTCRGRGISRTSCPSRITTTAVPVCLAISLARSAALIKAAVAFRISGSMRLISFALPQSRQARHRCYHTNARNPLQIDRSF